MSGSRRRTRSAGPRDIASEPPKRIQRRRTKGWRLPPNAVYVGRPTFFGNPYRAGEVPPKWPEPTFTVADAVRCYELLLAGGYRLRRNPGYEIVTRAMEELEGLDLACWCPLAYSDGSPHPCHADILLLYANAPVDLGGRLVG